MGAHHHFLPLRIRLRVRQKRPFPLQLARFRFTRTLGVFQCWIERTERLRLNSGTISRIYGHRDYRMVVTELILTSQAITEIQRTYIVKAKLRAFVRQTALLG